jgi:alpha-L-fucosidase
MASIGGNFLFNVGPNPDGTFPPETKKALSYIGNWMKINHESIYGTSKNPFYKLDFGAATVKELNDNRSKVYLHVFDWPENQEIILRGLNNSIGAAYLLDGNKTLSYQKLDEGVKIKGLPKQAPHEAVSVIVLEINEPLDITPGYLEFENDSISLKPENALMTIKPQFDDIPVVVEKQNFSYFDNWKSKYPHHRFKNTGNQAHWKIIVPENGSYKLWLHCATQTNTNVIQISSEQSLKTTLPNTGGMDVFQNIYLGEIKLDKGVQTLTLTGGQKMEVWDYVRIGNITLKRNK